MRIMLTKTRLKKSTLEELLEECDTFNILDKTKWSMCKPNALNIREGDQLIMGKPKSTEEAEILFGKEWSMG